MVFTLCIGGFFHVKSRVFLRFDLSFFVICFAIASNTKEEEGVLIFIAAEAEVVTPRTSPSLPRPASRATDLQHDVHLYEPKVLLHLNSEEEKEVVGPRRWVLDTGATNHMMGSRNVFAELNTGITGTVKFGDGSVVAIEGKGTILFACKSEEHH